MHAIFTLYKVIKKQLLHLQLVILIYIDQHNYSCNIVYCFKYWRQYLIKNPISKLSKYSMFVFSITYLIWYMVKFIFKVNKIYVLHMQMHVTVPYGVKMHVCCACVCREIFRILKLETILKRF